MRGLRNAKPLSAEKCPELAGTRVLPEKPGSLRLLHRFGCGITPNSSGLKPATTDRASYPVVCLPARQGQMSSGRAAARPKPVFNPTPQIPTVLGGQARPLNHLSAGLSWLPGTGHKGVQLSFDCWCYSQGRSRWAPRTLLA